jgi:NADPH:quinone reductase-like Zn-dependent oxidoreductase
MTLAVTYRQHGAPADIVEVTDIGPPPAPSPGQIQVRVTAFPIHPGDLLAIAAARPEGRTVVAGTEASGVIAAIGSGVTCFGVGARVSFFPHAGAWAEIVNVNADVAVAVPDSVSDEVAAQMLCNPLSVLMLRRAAQSHFTVGFDGVVLNNAAASAVGRLFTAGAEHHHIATVSVVRSEQRAEQLRARFPTVPVVSTSAPDWQDRIRDAADGRPIPVALDPVGGSASTDLLSLVSPGGAVYLYGVLADADITLHAADLLNTEKSLRGISIGRWLTTVSPERRASDLASAVMLTVGLGQHLDTAAVFPLTEINDAVRAVTAPGKVGTVLVKP